MAAPPPPPPPPPAPAPIGKPNNAKLLDSIRAGTGLKKVPDHEKNDRSTVIAPTKPGGNTAPVALPPGMRGTSGAAPSLAEALKARQQAMSKGQQSNFPPPAGAPAKKMGAPPPNQNVNTASNVPKPPSQTSKPSIGNGETNSFPPPPPQQDKPFGIPPMCAVAASKPFAPPPMISTTANKPFAPPPMSLGSINKPLAPPLPGNSKPFAPPPLPPGNISKPLPPNSVPLNLSSLPPPPPMDSSFRAPPVFYSMKPTNSDSNRPTMVHSSSIPNSTKCTPPQFAPPPPPPTSSMPTKSSSMIGKPLATSISLSTTDGPQGRPPLPSRMEMTTNFDSRFTFADESLFPDPSSVSKRTRRVV